MHVRVVHPKNSNSAMKAKEREEKGKAGMREERGRGEGVQGEGRGREEEGVGQWKEAKQRKKDTDRPVLTCLLCANPHSV